MAISRILGASLVSNLDREGVDLQFTTSGNTLVYMDFANFRLGVNTDTPNQPLHVVGNILVADGNVIASANLTSDIGDSINWFRDIYVGNVKTNNLYGTIQTPSQPYITSLGTLTELSVTGNISAGNISTTGTMAITGDLSVDDITANTFTGNVVTANQPYITTLSNITVDSLTTAGNVTADYAIANAFVGGNIYGTIQTTHQPFITNLGNISVDSISIGGNISITGNTSGGIINADELYEAGYRVLTTNTTIDVNGDVTGSGTYSNVYVELTNTGVTAGVYGAADDETWDRIPKITVDSKGRITNIANITLTQVGNVTFTNTTVSTTSNLTLAPANGYIFANNSIISNLADPVSNQDAVTLSYLNTQLSSTLSKVEADDSAIDIIDDGVTPGVVTVVVDATPVANISATSFEIYNTLTAGNLTINDVTISSAGNIFLDAQGNGIVQISGTDALGIPAGGVGERPATPVIGYTRFNTDYGILETWDGSAWYAPATTSITSQTITPDGISNTYTLNSSVNSPYAVLVSINGTLQQPVTSYDVVADQLTFTEIPHDTDIIEVRIISSGVTVTGLQNGAITLSVTASGNVTTNANLLPTVNSTYNVGSDALRWKDLYLSGSSIHLGNIVLKENSGAFQVFASDGVTPASLQANDPTSLQDVVTLNYLQTQLSGIDTTTIVADDTVIQIIDDGIHAGNIVIAVDGSNVARVGASRVNLYKDLEVTGNVLADQYQYANGVNILTSIESTIASVEANLVSNVATLTANAGAQSDSLAALTANAGVQSTAISDIQTNYANRSGATFTGSVTISNATQSSSASTGALVVTGGVGIGANLYVSGNLYVAGTQTTVNSNNTQLNDTLLYLADNNTSDVLDIGIVSSFTNPGYQHTGLVRDASDGQWKLFANVTTEPSTTVDFTNATYSNLRIGDLTAVAGTFTGNVSATLSTSSQPYITSLGTITSGTWNGTTIDIAHGGTGATTTTGVGGALDNLLPSGEQTGYVLATSGVGSYYWTSPAAGGATVGQQLTTQRQANAIVSNTTVISLAGISYTPGAGQLRVYINGVRQFPSAYTETSNVSYTLSANVVSGDNVFTEIDQFSSFNNYANLTYASNVGTISAVGLTVQTAIESLENNKAPKASPTFTGNLSSGNVSATYLTGTLLTAAQTNITSVGTLSSLSVTGNVTTGNVSGTYVTGTLLTAAQTNITSVGTLTALTLSGLITGKTNTGGNVSVSNDSGSMSVRGDNTNAAVMSFHRPGAYAINMGLDTDNTFKLGGWSDGTGVYRLQVTSTGGVTANSLGIGTTASGTTGEIRATNNITAYYTSDVKFKQNIQDVPNALDKVVAIGTKSFDWTDEYIQAHGGEDGYFVRKNDFGVIAQDVQAVFPEAVRVREDGTLAVDYEKLAVLSFGAIKELLKRIEALESK